MADKGLEKELNELGLTMARPFMLPEEHARQLGARCRDCQSPQVIYLITQPFPGLFDAGAYCYKCLLVRCLASGMIPFPVEANLLDKLKADMRISRYANPKYIIKPRDQ